MNLLFRIISSVEIDTSSLPRVGTDPKTNVVVTLLNLFFGILAGVAFITVVYGGFKYVISQGEPDKIGKAKDIIMYSLIGLAVAFSAFGIVNVFLKAIT